MRYTRRHIAIVLRFQLIGSGSTVGRERIDGGNKGVEAGSLGRWCFKLCDS